MSQAMRVRPFTDAEIAAYRRDGVAHLPALVDSATVRVLTAASETRFAMKGRYAEELTERGRFFDERMIYPENADFRRFVLESGLGEQAGRAIEAAEVRAYFDHLFLCEADTPMEHYWHQDLPYWPTAGNKICSVWLALNDCTTESSALEFVIGSDRGPFYAPARFGNEDDASFDQGDPDAPPMPRFHQERDKYRLVSWEIKAGDAILFNTRIVHASGGNRSKTQRRIAYSTRWIGEDMVWKLKPGFQDPALFPKKPLKDGDRLIAEEFPLVWKRG